MSDRFVGIDIKYVNKVEAQLKEAKAQVEHLSILIGDRKEDIRILKARIAELEERERFLNCLEAVGVDNWSGYGMAWDLFEGREPTY